MFESYREAEGVEILQFLYERPDIEVAVDTETTGLHVGLFTGGDRCIGVSIAFVAGDRAVSHYYGLTHETGVNVSDSTKEMLGYVLEQPERPLIFANVQFDTLSLETVGILIEHQRFIDIIAMAHLINENQPMNKSLDSLAAYYLKDGSQKVKDLFVEAEKKSGNHNITPEQMFEYACVDTELTWRVKDLLKDHKNWTSLPEDVWDTKQDTVRVLNAMKRVGVRIDTVLSQKYIDLGIIAMHETAGKLGYPAKQTKKQLAEGIMPMPVLGPIALSEIFLERLSLPVLKTSKISGKPSFDKEVMEQYDEMLEKVDSPEAQLVKQYRGWQKAVSAAYKPYVALLDPDGRLRCSYKLHGTKTGRLSCFEPNLQQIPKSSDKAWNGKIKECFIAQEGYTLLNADFSQLELRLGTAYAGEEALKQVFREGRDIFTEMAASLGFARQDTKTLVYSMQYGAGLKRIMNVFGVSKVRADQIRNNYFNTYPAFKYLADRCSSSAENHGKVQIWTGRYRHFEYASESFKAMNSVIQGGAADIVERVMIQCWKKLHNDDCRMLLQVHDSITWEVRTELVDYYMPLIKEVMEDVNTAVGHDKFDVKFAVEVDFWTKREEATYTNWKELQAA